MTYIDMGLLPPPEILLTLNQQFKRYFPLGGEIDLDQACFGDPKKGVGNYSAIRK